MPRPNHLPTCPQVLPSRTTNNSRTYQIELITPMFGGGVETRTIDTDLPIRPTSIRGQLQFWWRATVGLQYRTRGELRDAQSAIWGNTEQASKVQVRVDDIKADPVLRCARFDENPDRYRSVPTWNPPFQDTALPYALFPFQGQLAKGGQQIEVQPAQFIPKASFRLTIDCAETVDFAKQVEPALIAWITFGGLGSRTRRGCGAIMCQSFLAQDLNDLQSRLKGYLSSDAPKEWPTLAAAILVGREYKEPIRAWNEVIRLFQKFRQGVGVERNPGQRSNQPGRLRWPEPETIRRVTKQRHNQHQRTASIPDDAFPRAELGLPIVFHFKDKGEPPDTVLYPDAGPDGEKRERMASPLILKPVALQNGRFVPLIVQLKTPLLTGVDLRQGDQSLKLPTPTSIRDPRLARYEHSPMQDRSPNGSAIEAFRSFARSEGFTEVTR